MKKSIFKIGMLAVLVSFASCSEQAESLPDDTQTRNTKVSITDAPIDNAEVSGAFVTITDVKVNGVSVEGFNTTTIDLMTLQNGKKEILGDLDLKVGSMSEVSLVLDYDFDEDGNSPGSFIKTTDGVKHKLEASTKEIKIADRVEVLASSANEIIIDFDLRKTIIASNDNNHKFDFVTDFELSNGLRLVNNDEAGTVSGSVSDSKNTSDKILVFAYKVGAYTEAETRGQGASNVRFANAETSAVVSSNSTYSLSFLKEGDYEIKFASFTDEDQDGELEFKGMLDVESTLGINLNSVNVSSKTNLNLLVNVKGVK
ncbi:DUF4382 domain-containing protein [Polaribacter aquimarinus]|uniref:DUF4382 domain-containing protein n=1 Tax=Polaribacter aquimarinus TaxID=2100726 RepID=A0A2U2JCU2_9FLAO|nr:DUF4382 domain-containing protein [Polaribacter aquimarinus]PWG06157.1 hypothetical protein DIS07_06935 [Polaribacter aquimarinus]